jgi:SAM-dependent MidA family methyltransferase
MTLNNPEQLIQTIRQQITQSGGAIPFATFMQLALYAPNLGYYNTGKRLFGRGGDFVTASEISPLFAACIAKQCQQILTALGTGDMLEIGAGSGQFAKNVLLELQQLNCLPRHYFIYEISPALRAQQLQLFEEECPALLNRVHWLDELPSSGINGIIFANEVLDALPVTCFQVTEEGVQERCVTWENDHFAWKNNAPTASDFAAQIKTLAETVELAVGYTSEIHLEIPKWLRQIAPVLTQGVILLIDYGYGRREYYHPDRTQGTLMCFHQHRSHSDPFAMVGLQDITAHVDFTTVAEQAVDLGLTVAGYTTQAAFLLASGLLALAEERQSASAADIYTQAQAIKTLTLPSQMGEIIKVIALTKQIDFPLTGFALHDRRKDL